LKEKKNNKKVNKVIVERHITPIKSHPTVYPQKDIIRDYDYNKIYNPLEQPSRRIPRNELYPYHLKRNIDIPSQGYPDNFSQLGILIKQNDNNSENKILRLFGRQEYPRSERYEYYTAINSGLDQIKIPLDIKRRELYDDDIVYVKELDSNYRVQLHKYDAPKYYPDIFP